MSPQNGYKSQLSISFSIVSSIGFSGSTLIPLYGTCINTHIDIYIYIYTFTETLHSLAVESLRCSSSFATLGNKQYKSIRFSVLSKTDPANHNVRSVLLKRVHFGKKGDQLL